MVDDRTAKKMTKAGFVALIGAPNAGKSTLIRAVSAAKPKVANYPFTTLQPNLGVVRLGMNSSFVMADIPGLIAGASEGAGLGHQFLKHLQRTKLLVHVVDIGTNYPDIDAIINQIQEIYKELTKYDRGLFKKPRWITFNKIDLIPAADRELFINKLCERLNLETALANEPYTISAIASEGTDSLVASIMKHIEDTRPTNKDVSKPKNITAE